MLYAEKCAKKRASARAERISAAQTASNNMRTKINRIQKTMSASSAEELHMKKIFLAFILLISMGMVFAHEEIEHENALEELQHNETGGTILFWIGIGFAGILALAIYSYFFVEKMGEKQKTVFFALIAITAILVTGYMVLLTVQKNTESETGGPVHWHADFEIWICGEKIELEEPTGLDNKMGINILHHHNDNRIHIEGTPKKKSDVKLGNFFAVIGGEFNENTIAVVQKDLTLIRRENGNLCNGVPGTVQLYVNGEKNFEFGEHVIAAYSNVPRGDFLQIVFDSKEGIPNGG